MNIAWPDTPRVQQLWIGTGILFPISWLARKTGICIISRIHFSAMAEVIMNYRVFFLVLSICILRGEPLAQAEATYTNPVIGEIGPADPCVIFYEDLYYLYPTGDNVSYHVYTSSDLVDWEKGKQVFVPGEKNVWAPDVFRDPNDGKFYLYYTVDKRIGVAVAEKPDALFKDIKTLYKNAIDAHMFYEDGDYYLYYVQLPGFRIHVQKMKTPVEKDGEPLRILHPTEPWEKVSGAVTEGPWMLKHEDAYYLLYSGTGADSLNYAIGYATAAHPMGPFKKYEGNPIVR
ncbi:family 43 glycosylhydrolase, partial [bacterium]|nr:family 43 glycosylhydrolase [bacterium]